MKDQKILIFGASETAGVLFDSLSDRELNNFFGFVVDVIDERSEFMGYPLIMEAEMNDLFDRFGASSFNVYLGVGYGNLNRARESVLNSLTKKKCGLRPFISEMALVSKRASVGLGSVILEFNNLQKGVSVGSGVFMWSHNHVGHLSHIGDCTYLASKICISGRAEIGERCFLGVGVNVNDGIVIGSDSAVGSGITVKTDLPDCSYYSSKHSSPKVSKNIVKLFQRGFL